MEYAFHEVADIFPLMQGEEFSQLVNDIREHGLRELIWLYDGKIIDGRNRYRACEEAGVDPKFREWVGEGSLVAFVVSLNLHRRHLDESQRGMVAGKIANLKHGGDRRSDDFQDSNLNLENTARMLNIGRTTAAYGKKVADEGSLLLVSKVASGEVAVSTAAEIATLDEDEQDAVLKRGEAETLRKAKDIKRKRAKRRVEERTAQRAHAVTLEHPLSGNRYRLLHGDLLSVGGELAHDSIDAIITDPPYSKEFLPVYDKLWQLAHRILRPGGHCLVMVGQSHLPQILAPFSGELPGNLSYQWTLGYFTPGQSTQVFGRKVKSNWKPVLWFVKGKNEWEHIKDVVQSERKDKRFHEWGQPIEVMAQLIELFTVKKAVICDPFCGGGSTGVAALELGRFFVGIDIDISCVQQTAERLQQIQEAA